MVFVTEEMAKKANLAFKKSQTFEVSQPVASTLQERFGTMSRDKIPFPTDLIIIGFINNLKYLDVEYGLIPTHLSLKTSWVPVFCSLCFSC